MVNLWLYYGPHSTSVARQKITTLSSKISFCVSYTNVSRHFESFNFMKHISIIIIIIVGIMIHFSDLLFAGAGFSKTQLRIFFRVQSELFLMNWIISRGQKTYIFLGNVWPIPASCNISNLREKLWSIFERFELKKKKQFSSFFFLFSNNCLVWTLLPVWVFFYLNFCCPWLQLSIC